MRQPIVIPALEEQESIRRHLCPARSRLAGEPHFVARLVPGRGA
jgi:hypothetical protein